VTRLEPMGKLALAHRLLTALRPPGPSPLHRSAADP
jgi:hypothetical protein